MNVRIIVASLQFVAHFEEKAAPETCAAFEKLVPYRQKIIHAGWSGEACWVPLGDFELGVGIENPTTFPGRGELLFYPGDVSETEILFPYGSCCFACKAGQLAGNHFLTVSKDLERLAEVGRLCLWEGAQDISFERC